MLRESRPSGDSDAADVSLQALAGAVRDLDLHELITPVTEQVAARIGTLDQPADVIAVFAQPEAPPLDQLRGLARPVVYADHLADPGNLGTLLRAAAAFGAAAVLTSPCSADLWSPKVVRAAMGASFALPLYAEADLEEALEQLGSPVVYGLAAHGGADVRSVPLRAASVLCVGAERAGLSPAVAGRVDELLTIPLPGVAETGVGTGAGVESLNAAVAAAIALYELSRRGDPGAAPAWDRPGEPSAAAGGDRDDAEETQPSSQER